VRPGLSQLRFLSGKLRHGYVWKRVLLERMTEPLHLNVAAAFVAVFGSFRAKVAFDLVLRHHHAYGLLSAADQARELGKHRLTLLEFGVGGGAGLLNMAHVAARVTQATGVAFDIYGFDTGHGLPRPRSFRDHPELWQEGDFAMDVEALRRLLPSNVTLVLGDVAETVPAWLETFDPSAPIGFVSLDLDYYYSTKDAVQVFHGPPEAYLPRTCLYLDDIEHPSHNSFCGELLAIGEFNDGSERRKIEKHPFLPKTRVFHRAPWIEHIYTLHVLDHPSRSTLEQPRHALRLLNPYLSDATART
jgi:hypothetical protein